MRLAYFIAKRYLIAKKSTNAINIIAAVSVLGIFIASAALFIILSVFNGFENLVLSLYNKFAPDLKIEAVSGKTFNPNDARILQLQEQDFIEHYVETLEDKVLLRWNDQQYIATLKGVSNSFLETGSLDSNMIRGALLFEYTDMPMAVIGSGLEYFLGFNMLADQPLQVFSPRKGKASSGTSISDLNQQLIYVSGVFQVQQDFDTEYLFAPLPFVRKQLGVPENVSSIDIYLKPNASLADAKNKATALLGSDFKIRDRFEQNELLYKILNAEKWAVYLILTFVLIIAVCNIWGSLTMLVIEKKQDIAVLFSLGASKGTIKLIFLIEGLLLSIAGALSGLITGIAVCWVQKTFGLIRISRSETLVVNTYPVDMHASDFILVLCTVLSISFLASWQAAGLSVSRFSTVREELLD